MFRVCSEYVQSMSEFLQSFFRVSSELLQSFFRVSSEFRQSVFRVSSEFLQSFFRVSSEYLQSFFRVCSGYVSFHHLVHLVCQFLAFLYDVLVFRKPTQSKDYWRANIPLDGFSLCSQCPQPPNAGTQYKIQCRKHNS